jgi:hypothetical protein
MSRSLRLSLRGQAHNCRRIDRRLAAAARRITLNPRQAQRCAAIPPAAHLHSTQGQFSRDLRVVQAIGRAHTICARRASRTLLVFDRAGFVGTFRSSGPRTIAVAIRSADLE